MGKLNKTDLVNIIAEKAYLNKNDALNAVDAVFETIEKSILNGDEVTITNFATFVPITKTARVGTNPKTHEQITIKEKRTVSFKLSKTLKDKLK